MDWLREWILRISGIIILISACDIIMIEGEMKKYIKPILGLLLVFAVIRPISGDVLKKMNIDLGYASSYSSELIKNMEGKQLEDIRRLFEERLEKDMEERLYQKYGAQSEVILKTSAEKEKIAEIESINIDLYVNEGKIVNTEDIKRYLEKDFGVSKEVVTVSLKETG